MATVHKTARKYDWLILPVALVYRILTVFICQTYFVPDEYWQSLEVAHKYTFGYGHVTWEWDKAIRSSIHPFMFVGVYKMLSIINLDTSEMIVLCPRLVQAVLAAVCDLFVYKIAQQLWSSRVFALYAYILHFSFWFSIYCMTRTLSNTLETVLTTIGIHYWLSGRKQFKFSKIGFTFGALSCLIRPTAIFMWFPIATIHILTNQNGPLNSILKDFIPIGTSLLILSFLCDFIFYGKFVSVQYNFLHFNVFEGVANFYGTHPWHWYFTQGVVVVWLSWTPVVLFATCGILLKAKEKFLKGKTKSKRLSFSLRKMFTLNHHIWILLLIIFEVLAYSFLGHKEFRFILPILPLTAVLIAPNVHSLWTSRRKSLRVLCVGLFLSNIVAAGYFCLVHQRGTLDAVSFLRQEVGHSQPNASVLFLLPCHHAPFYSHIHKNVSMKFLQCQPDIDPAYVNEDDEFHRDPLGWLRREYSQKSNLLPKLIVVYDVVSQKIDPFLKQYGFHQKSRFFHTHFPDGPHIGTHVLIFTPP